jgi:hypothetical protein
VPALVLFTLLLLTLTGVAAAMLIALPWMEGRLAADPPPVPAELPPVNS